MGFKTSDIEQMVNLMKEALELPDDADLTTLCPLNGDSMEIELDRPVLGSNSNQNHNHENEIEMKEQSESGSEEEYQQVSAVNAVKETTEKSDGNGDVDDEER